MNPTNSPWFAAYLRDVRQHDGRSQQQISDAGGPYRQMQASIENEERDDVPDGACAMYDRAYGWPTGYARALAGIGEYVDNGQLSDALRGNDSDAAVLPPIEGAPPMEWKTFGGFYDQEPEQSRRYPIIGFDAQTGALVGLEGPTLTNIGIEHLHAIIRATSLTAIIDANLVDSDTVRYLHHYTDDWASGAAKGLPRPIYRTGPDEIRSGGIPLVIDPLSEITSLEDAKRLVAPLRAVYPKVETSTVKAAFTLLAAVAFGGDPMVTVTALKRRALGVSDPEFDRRFDEFWAQFRDPAQTGPDLAEPEYHVSDLLAGLLGARDELLRVVLHGTAGERRPARFETPEAELPGKLMGVASRSPIVFYDSHIAPEIPAVLCSQWPSDGLAFQEVNLEPMSRVRPCPGGPYFRIGISGARDSRIVDQHDRRGLSTLTNFVNGQAIYCGSGRAQRIWIPTV